MMFEPKRKKTQKKEDGRDKRDEQQKNGGTKRTDTETNCKQESQLSLHF